MRPDGSCWLFWDDERRDVQKRMELVAGMQRRLDWLTKMRSRCCRQQEVATWGVATPKLVMLDMLDMLNEVQLARGKVERATDEMRT